MHLLKYDEKDVKYKNLISIEYRYINSNKKEIYKRANKMYKVVINNKNNFLKTIACNFKLLEEKSLKYKNKSRKNWKNKLKNSKILETTLKKCYTKKVLKHE